MNSAFPVSFSFPSFRLIFLIHQDCYFSQKEVEKRANQKIMILQYNNSEKFINGNKEVSKKEYLINI